VLDSTMRRWSLMRSSSRVGDTELGGHIEWVVQELAQIPECGQLEQDYQIAITGNPLIR